DEHHAAVPRDAVIAPAPRTERRSHRYTETEADSRSDEEARSRTRIDHDRIVSRNHNVIGASRHDGDVRSAGHNDLRAAAQIAIVAGFLPHSLHRIHHVLLLAQKG